MSQLDINHNSRHTSLSSIRYRNFVDDDTDQKRISATSPTSAKRYATYELNWSNPSYSDHIDRIDRLQNNDTSTNSAQVASRWSLPNPSPPPTIPLPPIPQEKLQQKQQQHNNNININSNNNNNNNKSSRHSRKSLSPINTRRSELRDKNNDDEPQSPFGGITVTTVKVVEILHSPTEQDPSNGNDEFKGKSKQKNSRPEPLNLTSADPVGIITSEGNKDRKDRKDRKQRINLSPPPPPPVSRPPPPLPQNHNFKNHDPKMLKQKKRSSIINSQKIIGNKNVKKPEIIIPKEMAFIDPRLLAHNKSLIRTPSTKSTTAAVTTTTTTTTTKNRNRKILKRGGSFYRKRGPPKNLEFGSTSNPIHSNDPTDMEADLPPLKQQMFPWLPGSSKPPQLLHASLVPLPRMNRGANRDSHIITNNMIENASVKPKRNSKLISGRLSRVNSQRRRTSFIAPDPNRASLVFRRQILEESLMMSFGGMMMNGVQQQPTSVIKPPIRRKTKKVSNAKIEDRETRRERRRKAKEGQNNNNVIEGENGSNVIIKSQKNELYMGPQPPPRKPPQDITITPPPQKPKNNALSLLPSPTDQKLGNCSSLESSTDDPPPFPAHLARSTLFFENNSNKERSKRKQPTYSPSIGQSASSPITPISNYSHVTPSTSEGNDLINDEESQFDIISSEETSTIHQLPSPTLTPNKSQKIGMSILGLFNKQTTKDSTTPPFSQIGSPALYPTQLPPLSSSTTPLSSTPPLSTTPPDSPPLSPKSLKVPQQLLGKSRRGTENGSVSPPAVQDQDKKRKIEKKMEQFEALIASSEVPSSKKPITEKIKAITTAITTVASTATSSASSSIISNTSLEKRKKSADGTASNSPRYSSEESFKSVRNESGLRRESSSSRDSLANSLTDSIRERSELGPGDDGVIRVTLTPAVCR